MNQLQSIGKIVKQFKNGNFYNSYFLYGDDIYLQDFFIKNLKKRKNNADVLLFYLGFDNQIDIVNELSNLSLFNQEKIIIIKNIKKFSKQARNEIIEYLKNPNSNNHIIFVKNSFENKNKFIDSIISNCITIDVRTPFENKMVDWIKYICKSDNIKINENDIPTYIDAYGTNLSSVMNYIRIDYLSNAKNNNQLIRKFFLWHLQDYIGKKKLAKTVEVFDSLILNGNNSILIGIYLFRLFELMYNHKTSFNKKTFSFGINKIIQNRMSIYSSNFKLEEIENIILKIMDIDHLSKTTNLDTINLNRCLIANICKGRYE